MTADAVPHRVDPADEAAVAAQLGLPARPRAVRSVAPSRLPLRPAHRGAEPPRACPTAPRPPTLYYLTCARLSPSRIGGLEADGRYAGDDRTAWPPTPSWPTAYRRAHESYLAERDAIEPLGTQVSAGGMPGRVKCLHVHVAHALAAGPGVNPFGDETLAELGDWWAPGPCVPPPA